MKVLKNILIITALILFPLSSIANEKLEAPVKKITEMLYPTVMVDLGQGQGSGTIIFSGKRLEMIALMSLETPLAGEQITLVLNAVMMTLL